MPNTPNSNLDENELRIAVLRVLEHMRKTSDDQPGGASGKMLVDVLGQDDVLEIEKALHWLRDNGYVEIGTRKFLITTNGQDYLRSTLSNE